MKKFVMTLLAGAAALCALLAVGCNTGETSAVKSVELVSEPLKTVYLEGEKFEPKGGKLLVTYSDGSKQERKLGGEMCSADLSSQGRKTVEVSLPGKENSASFEIYVAKRRVSHSASLQKVIDESAKGDVYVVCPGTFHEQLVFDDKEITLIGDGTVLVTGPREYGELDVHPQFGKEPGTVASLISIRNGSKVKLVKMTVFGDGKAVSAWESAEGQSFAGISILNSSAELEEVAVKSMVCPFKSGEQSAGIGILASSAQDGETLTLKKCRIEKFAECGILLRSGVTAKLGDCKIRGLGRGGKAAQYGVQTHVPAEISNCVFENFRSPQSGEGESGAVRKLGKGGAKSKLSGNVYKEVDREELTE